jgi:hypothetical protein
VLLAVYQAAGDIQFGLSIQLDARSAGHEVVTTDLPGIAPATDVLADLTDAGQADALINEARCAAVIHAD